MNGKFKYDRNESPPGKTNITHLTIITMAYIIKYFS